MPRMRLTFSTLVLVAGLTGAGGICGPALFGTEQTHEPSLAENVDGLIKAWEPLPEERRFDDIGWAKDIREALRLAKEHNRPVFLFTYSGSAEREHAMALQRC